VTLTFVTLLVGFCEVAACSRIFWTEYTVCIIILSPANAESIWYFGYAVSSNLTFFAYITAPPDPQAQIGRNER